MSSRSLRIGIDGRGILKTIDGITRYSLNLIRSLSEIDSTNKYFIFKNRWRKKKIVDAPNFQEIEVDFPHLSMKSLFHFPFLIKHFNLDIFHSPFFIAPLWNVNNLIITVHVIEIDHLITQRAETIDGNGLVNQRIRRQKVGCL